MCLNMKCEFCCQGGECKSEHDCKVSSYIAFGFISAIGLLVVGVILKTTKVC